MFGITFLSETRKRNALKDLKATIKDIESQTGHRGEVHPELRKLIDKISAKHST